MSCLLLPAVGTRRIVLFSREKLTHLVLNKVFYLVFFFFPFCWLYIKSSVIIFPFIEMRSSFLGLLLLAV